ncbi:SET domain-containing protein-lysine N-methyltransferase [Micromonospora sp. NPDC047793]|uniref:SET domain-containing protein-lysine N-methyltransferase n=1 Tax=Micromonospora sp. NPDC047793 TaxID=3154342 RepID=UPI0033D4CB2A
MLHSALHPGYSRIHGVGIIALRDIPMGTALWWPCPKCSVFSESVQPSTPEGVLRWLTEFGYRRADGGLITPCRGAHLLNHSCAATVLDAGLSVGIAVVDIRKGDEVTCDYRTFRYDDAWHFTCSCNAPECAGTIASAPGGPPAAVSAAWRHRVNTALTAAATVAQETTVRAGDINGVRAARGGDRAR